MNTLYEEIKDINTPVRGFKYEELLELFWQSPYNFKVDLISKTRFIISVYPNEFEKTAFILFSNLIIKKLKLQIQVHIKYMMN